MIFPEGTRSADGSVGPFKAGSLKLALLSGVPIVPISISDSKDIMPKGSSVIRSASVNVVVSAPLLADELNGLSSNDIAKKVREIILANQK